MGQAETEQQPTNPEVDDAREETPTQEEQPTRPQDQAKVKTEAPLAASLIVVEGSKFFQEIKRPQFLEAITESLPAHVGGDMWVRHMMNYFRDHPQIQTCSLQSIQSALLNCAASGLDLGFGSRAYLIPYWNGAARVNEARFVASYMGLIELMRNSGMVKDVRARVVHENDFCEVILGSVETLEHRPVWNNPGEAIGAYSVAVFTNDTTSFSMMTASEIEAVKTQALAKLKNKEQSPWNGPFEEEMWKKTAIRRHAKTLPLSPATRKALGDIEAYEEREPMGAPIDVTDSAPKQSRTEQVSERLKRGTA